MPKKSKYNDLSYFLRDQKRKANEIFMARVDVELLSSLRPLDIRAAIINAAREVITLNGWYDHASIPKVLRVELALSNHECANRSGFQDLFSFLANQEEITQSLIDNYRDTGDYQRDLFEDVLFLARLQLRDVIEQEYIFLLDKILSNKEEYDKLISQATDEQKYVKAHTEIHELAKSLLYETFSSKEELVTKLKIKSGLYLRFAHSELTPDHDEILGFYFSDTEDGESNKCQTDAYFLEIEHYIGQDGDVKSIEVKGFYRE
jgi:transcription termination factor NusB